MKKDIQKNWILYALLSLAFLVGFIMMMWTSCSPVEFFYDKYSIEDDNVIEEVGEYIIEQRTGGRIDLTPTSKED